MAQVYADSNAMQSWKSNMQSINSNCLDDIDNIDSIITSLNDSFQGDYADAFTESFSEFTSIIKESHVNMKDFSGFLDKIFEIMNNQ